MSEHQRETAFLRHLISYADAAERRELDDRISNLERDQRCLRRAVWVMTLSTALAAAGLCYAAVFLLDHRMNASQFMAQTLIRVFSAVALGSLACALAFHVLGIWYRKDLDQHREQCRRLAMKLIESRLGIEAVRNEVASPAAVPHVSAPAIAGAQ
jgi:hypothetical protein